VGVWGLCRVWAPVRKIESASLFFSGRGSAGVTRKADSLPIPSVIPHLTCSLEETPKRAPETFLESERESGHDPLRRAESHTATNGTPRDSPPPSLPCSVSEASFMDARNASRVLSGLEAGPRTLSLQVSAGRPAAPPGRRPSQPDPGLLSLSAAPARPQARPRQPRRQPRRAATVRSEAASDLQRLSATDAAFELKHFPLSGFVKPDTELRGCARHRDGCLPATRLGARPTRLGRPPSAARTCWEAPGPRRSAASARPGPPRPRPPIPPSPLPPGSPQPAEPALQRQRRVAAARAVADAHRAASHARQGRAGVRDAAA
jgi:hypothetical protein